ncbi:MAG: hypothetical protein IJ515_02805 [Clostridia bacterium]|nr:hypothetical protein [Clostridia bacterium]
MGFGTFFIGYFLLMNLTYYSFTDLIAGLVMLMAVYKLRGINKHFAAAIIPAVMFSVIAAIELVSAVGIAFGTDLSFLLNYTDPARYLCIGFLSERMLMGISVVAKEVDAQSVARHARLTRPFAIAVFALGTVMQFPYIDSFIPTAALNIIAVILTFVIFIQLIVVLFSVYGAYRWICMPEDVNNEKPDTPSRFGFVNQFREHEEEKRREYAEYQAEKLKKKASKKANKKRKK